MKKLEQSSFLFLSTFLSFLFFLSSGDVAVLLPDLFYMFVVLFLRNLHGVRKDSDYRGVLLLVSPVSSAVAECVAQINIDVLGNEELDDLCVSLAGGDVEAGEADLVLDLGVTSAVHELLDGGHHVLFGREVHRCVAADVEVVLNVGLCAILEEDFDNRVVLGLNGVLKQQVNVIPFKFTNETFMSFITERK